MVSLWDICLVKFREIGDMWLPLLFLSLLGGASGLEVGVKSLGTWFVEHPQFAVALPGESVFFDCKTNSEAGDEAIRWLLDGQLIPKGDPEYK